MIQRENMLELARRMTPARSHIDRIAGAYYDAEGYIDGTFNTHFLKLSTAEKTKNLELAKAVLQAETNKQLKDYRIPETEETGSISSSAPTKMTAAKPSTINLKEESLFFL